MTRTPVEVRNDRKNAVTKFCLAMEEHRRTEAGRVRTAREMLEFFFSRTDGGAEDRIFVHIPPAVRGPIVSAWGIRGAKSAVRDTDEKTRQVVLDALVAGDVDELSFEEGLNAQTIIDWVPLASWWSFWRTGKLTSVAIQKALAVGRELSLFDDRWFLLNVEGRGGRLKGTDTLCDTLSKDQIVSWIRKLHESGDGSPAGLVAALGWETVLSKTSQEALLFALDAMAKKVGLVPAATGATEMPGRPDELVLPDISGFDVTPLEEEKTASRSSAPSALEGARSVMAFDDEVGTPNVTSSPTQVSASSTSSTEGRSIPAQSTTMLTADESQVSFRASESDTAEYEELKAIGGPLRGR